MSPSFVFRVYCCLNKIFFPIMVKYTQHKIYHFHNFYWSIVDLQYSVYFRTAKWFSDTCLYMYMNIYIFHYRLLQYIEHSSLCYIVNPLLLIYFTYGKVKSLSCVRLLETPWTVAYQDPQSMGFSRQEYWSVFPFPSPHYILHMVMYMLIPCS